MSTLRAIVGYRDTATKSPGIAVQPRSEPVPGHDRVQAKLLEMGFSNVQDHYNSTDEAQNKSQPKRQIVGDQQRIAHTRTKLHRNFAASSSTNHRWQGNKSTPVSPPFAKDETKSEQVLPQGPRNRRDPFDTDSENLDSTITPSDLGEVQTFQSRPLLGLAASNGLDQVYESEYFRGESMSSVAEHTQHHYGDSLNAPGNDLKMNEEDYAIDNGLDENNDEDAPNQGDQTSNGLSSQGLAEELNSPEYIHLHSKEPTLTQSANARHFMASPTLYRKLAMRNSGERSPDSASQFTTVPRLDHGHTIDARRRLAGTPYVGPKHDSARFEDSMPNSSAGTSKPLEQDVPNEKQISNSSRQGYQHKTPAIGVNQSLTRQQSEPTMVKVKTLTISENPVCAMASAYNFLEIPNGAGRLLSHDDDDAAYETHSRKRGNDMDYNSTQLREMTYERLRHESFDRVKPVQGAADQGLSEKLQNVYDLRGSIDPHLKRRTFFSDLTIEQYEECGDIIVDRFSDMVTRYKVARQQKRMVAREFEEEIANREERVQAKNDVVGQDLGRLRKAGEDVVRGKGA